MKRILSSVKNLCYAALLSGLIQLQGSGLAWAGTPNSVRSSEHDTYSRLVFDGPSTKDHRIETKGNQILIHFAGRQNFSTDQMNTMTASRIASFKLIDDKTVEINMIPGQTVRQLQVDDRFILDLKGKSPSKSPSSKNPVNPTPAVPAQAQQPQVKKLTQQLADQTETAAGKESETQPEAPKDSPTPPADTAQAAPQTQVPEAAQAAETAPTAAPITITIAGTASFAAAAFEKSGQLWVVIDQENVTIPPQIEPENSSSPALSSGRHFIRVPAESVQSKGVSVFKIPLNELGITKGAKAENADGKQGARAEGGGLVWKIHYHEPTPPAKSAPPATEFERMSEDGGAKKFLLWPGKNLHRIAPMVDPNSGEKIFVVLVNSAEDYSIEPRKFTEFTSLPSPIGVAILSRADDLKVTKVAEGAKIAREDGLALSDEKDIAAYGKKRANQDLAGSLKDGRIFDFKSWQGGGLESLPETQRLMLSSLSEQTNPKKTENLINLGRLLISHGFAPESRGYFDLAQQFTPQIVENPEFLALQGASESLSGNYATAFADLSLPALQNIPEIEAWRSFALAGLDDWQQAGKSLNDPLPLLQSYPDSLAWPLGLKFTETALRAGNTPLAQKILKNLDTRRTGHTPNTYNSAFLYLKGEMMRQLGETDLAKDLWRTLESGKDDLYRVKAKLANAMLRYGQKEITVDKAIDTLEGLRYAWRGDELEGTVNYQLGKLYLDKKEPVKALSIMRQASELFPNSEQGKMINANMRKIFADLYNSNQISQLSPVDALTLYSEFPELVPAGAEGDALARHLAEHLADADLLARAIDLMQKQVDRLSGLEGAGVALRLAGLQIQDNKPKAALDSLAKADHYLEAVTPEDGDVKRRQSALLRAKANSMLGKTEDAFRALSLLPQDADVLKLRADIAWKAKKWQDAADSLEKIISGENISLTRPITEDQANEILNWAVALYLADNRYVLANLRERYSDAMKQTAKAKEFEVVTRPRQNILLSDRDTINTIIEETDIFSGFMNNMSAGAAQDLKATLKGDATKESGAGDTAKGPTGDAAIPSAQSSSPSGATPSPQTPKNEPIPDNLKNTPQLKTDEVLAD